MGYLICDECEGYYELKSGESSEDFDLICNCGGTLKLYNNLDDNYNNTVVNSDLENILLNDPKGAKRAHAAYLLGETKDPKYVDVLCEATKDKDGNVRRLSASALGKIGDIRAENALIKLLNDVKPQVRKYSGRALKKIKSKKVMKHNQNDDNLRSVRDIEYQPSNYEEVNLYDQKHDDGISNNELRESEVIGSRKGYSVQKSVHYHNIRIIGGIIGLIGLFGLYSNSIFLIIFFVGAIIFIYAYYEGRNLDKRIVGETIVKTYSNQLPPDYIIYNDVKLPGSYGSIDQIVIGPGGIYVIETKNYKGFFVVRDKEWFYKTVRTIKKAKSQPGKQVLVNAISLREFLIDNCIDMDGIWIQAIVTLVNKNFKIEEKPKHYTILFPETISRFIQNSNRNIDTDILNKITILLESYNKGMSIAPSANTSIVDPVPTSIYINSANGFTGDTINLTATLTDLSNNKPVQNKNILFKIDKSSVGEVTIINGIASLPYIITNHAGSYTISAEFLQDDTHQGSINTNILTVDDITPPDVIFQTN